MDRVNQRFALVHVCLSRIYDALHAFMALELPQLFRQALGSFNFLNDCFSF